MRTPAAPGSPGRPVYCASASTSNRVRQIVDSPSIVYASARTGSLILATTFLTPNVSAASCAANALRLSPSVSAKNHSASSIPTRRSTSSSVPSARTACPGKSGSRRLNASVLMSTIATSWPARASRSAIPAPTRPQPTITARTARSTSNHFVNRSLGRPAVAARPTAEAPPRWQARHGRCDGHGRDGHLLGRRHGHHVGRGNLLTGDDDLARCVLKNVGDRGPDCEVTTKALAIRQAKDDRVGADLDRLVDQCRRDLACLEQVAGQLDVVFLGDALGLIEDS